ncbi:MAG TPA: hypothetical protein PKU95_02740 [Candidatus Dojkabacteria bacterium]|jgi:hypothetical protein|nr:hypothetical protein [Candidatus Dojkabacteria bacterium]
MKKYEFDEEKIAKVGIIAGCGCLFLILIYSSLFFIASYFIYLLLAN